MNKPKASVPVLTELIPEVYQGREQALVKHRLLESYLQKLVLIIGASARRAGCVEICYVDCFAGPWGAVNSDLKGTSIAVAVETLAECKLKLASLGVTATMRALFVESDPAAFGRLQAYLEKTAPTSVKCDARFGDFLGFRQDILDWCGRDAFTFFFIDPKGWKEVGIETLRPLICRPRSEFLINFMYGFINRAVSMKDQEVAMTTLLGELLKLDANLSPDEREERILGTYRKNLKNCVALAGGASRPRTAYVRVLDPQKERPKYHLVYLTSHPKGVIEFMALSESIDLIQKRVRAVKRDSARLEKTGTPDMFGPESHVDSLDGHTSDLDVDLFWKNHLDAGEKKIGISEFADILESTDWFASDLQASLVRLIKSGQVVNLDSKKTRPTKPLHFEVCERLQLIP